MPKRRRAKPVAALWVVLAICANGTGCHHQQLLVPGNQLPRELDMASLPAYVIEPPDLLLIDALRVIPLPPYKIEPLDALTIQVEGADPMYPIRGVYVVEPEGTVNLGLPYGKVNVVGLTLEQAKKAVEERLLKKGLKDPVADVSLYQSRALQQIRGEHLVTPDGTIHLGLYGSVYVTSMSLEEAKKAIEEHLSTYLLNPEVSVDVLSYNSKVFYVITDGGGNGEQVVRLPITGNERVLDAMSNVGGLAPQASKKHIWIARPAPAGADCGDQILMVDWNAIVQCAKTTTNYQILPGDRIYVKANPLVTTDTWITRIIQPAERLFGVNLLGEETIRSFERGRGATGTGTGLGSGF